MNHSVIEFLKAALSNEEMASPLVLILGGLGALICVSVLKRLANRQILVKPTQKSEIEALVSRFQRRARLSWAMLGFGLLWFVQVIVESQLKIF